MTEHPANTSVLRRSDSVWTSRTWNHPYIGFIWTAIGHYNCCDSNQQRQKRLFSRLNINQRRYCNCSQLIVEPEKNRMHQRSIDYSSVSQIHFTKTNFPSTPPTPKAGEKPKEPTPKAGRKTLRTRSNRPQPKDPADPQLNPSRQNQRHRR